MKSTMQFDFIVDKEKNTLTVKREFAANRQLIWDCHTKVELLNQWFAPAPLTTTTKFMDFSEGGHWLYAMIDPKGPEYWGRLDYLKIKPIDSYSALDSFCDDKGEMNPDLPRANWNVTFTGAGENSLVTTVVTYKSLQALETVLQMGMQEGLTACMEGLDALLAKLNK